MVEDPNEAVRLEITDSLDLHSFPPSEIKELVRDYLDLAHAQGIRRLRIIHGKGIGAQRRTVRALLARDPRVARVEEPRDAAGWGATVVILR